MKQQNKLSSEQQQQQSAEHKSDQHQNAREFANAEELLRYDAAQTNVPPGIAQRLQKSSEPLPRPQPAWWKRFFGGAKT